MAQTNDSQEQVTINVETLQPVTRTLMTIGALPTSYLISMTYEEQLLWLQNYLIKTVIPAINNNAEATKEVQDIVMALQDYINDYFNNLDVQEEINNKLDQMVEDGTLTNIISTYVQPLIDEQNQEISEFKTQVNGQIAGQNAQIQAVTSGSPLVASSVSGMTDTTRVYVNTTDGHWYYYNGTTWVSGGVYQGTEVDNNSVSYNNLKTLLKNEDFETVTADDLLWRKGYTTYQGGINNSDNELISSVFILPKGNNIQISSDFKARITYYNLNGEYIGDTSTYKIIPNWSYTDDCIVRLNIVRVTNPETTDVSDANSTNVIFTGIRSKKYSSISDTISFTKFTDTRAMSNPIYVSKGTKISLFDCLLSKNGTALNSFVKFGVQESGSSKDMTNNSYWLTKGSYTVQKDGNLKIYIMFTSTPALDVEDYMSKFNNLLFIDNNNYNPIKNNPIVYIGNNANIDIKEISSNVALLLEGNLNIYNNSYKVDEISFTDILTAFPDNIIEVNNINYLKIPTYNIFYYDLVEEKLCINRFNSNAFLNRKDIVVLLANGYQNLCDGKLLDLYYKKQIELLNSSIGEIFNSSPIEPNYNWKPNALNFSKQLKNMSKNIETFMFFTDPHLLGHDYNENRLQKFINILQKYYNSTPTSFIVCGGDWLGNSDIQDEACFKLGYIDGFMNSMFDNYYPILGNHDTNYQGKIDEESPAWSGVLTKDAEIDLMFRKFKKMYYSFDGVNSKNYVLDTQLDNSLSMDAYKWEQIGWLAQELTNDDPTHATVMMHIIWNNSDLNLLPFTDNITKLISAYNNHETVMLNNTNYDFTNCTGHVDYVLGGHLHFDHDGIINNVLCIATTTFGSGQSVPTFDGIINDYDNNKVYFYRFGNGNSREFTI